MLGAIGYGIMGYFWQEIIYSFLGLLALTKMRDVLNATGGNAVVVAFVEALAGSVFVAAGRFSICPSRSKKQDTKRAFGTIFVRGILPREGSLP